ncbi:MAG: transporter substrate-binding domain-containing protein [Gammaproteobacteria bacterium]|nr:transporter substrate-binding domain-containing protein [Gammaproteobacteria bacterium]MCP5200646.1 transporter substrate-binding domain-containing protein [Gammaproteobacteria bacterium]
MTPPRAHCRQAQRRRLSPFRSFRARLLCVALLAWASTGVAAATESGVLRVLKLRHQETSLPYRDIAGEFRLLSDFARRQGLALEWIDAVQPGELENRLRAGEGDVVLAELPPGPQHTRGLLPGLGMGSYRQVVYGRQDLEVRDPRGLAGLRVAISIASPLWPYLNDLAAQVPGLVVAAQPDTASRDELLAGVADQRYDAVVIGQRPNENPIEALPRLRALFTLSPDNVSRWYFAPGAGDLRRRLDAYLTRFQAAVPALASAFGDLDVIRQRHVLRIITRIDPHNYFVRGGRPAGFEYELVRQFARSRGLGLEFLVADSDQQITDWLRRGVGDLVTTRINGAQVRADPALEQSRPYFHSASVIVQRRDRPRLTGDSLSGLRVGVLANSVQHRALGELMAAGLECETRVYPADMSPVALAERVQRGEIAAAVLDAYAIEGVRTAYPRLLAGTSLATPFRYAWTLRAGDKALKASVNAFLREQFRKATYNLLAKRYFEASAVTQLAGVGEISPYDSLVRRHAEANDFDWRLIVAQMYQESRFNPRAESRTGARGLMQLQPTTARALGVRDAFDPESAIRGGITYLKRLRQRFDASIAPRERTWFALAAYNIGYGPVERARRRAAATGLDPNRWFGNVEVVMRRMARTAQARRWGQAVVYVRAIRSLYNTYNRLHETLTAGLDLDRPSPAG